MITQLVNVPCAQCKRTWKKPVGTDQEAFICDACDLAWLDYLDGIAPEERCPTCGQPDNCGDCNHTPINNPAERLTIMGGTA